MLKCMTYDDTFNKKDIVKNVEDKSRFPLGGLVGEQPGRTSMLRTCQNESNESICSNKNIIYC